ncbi:MFS transporter [Pseudonocardia xishanensis]|uniref:MFS transporter n=1 Tax=Pseudonocardia xishanensis TaxID=630995 RepID=A0ABP8RNX8_9PSEU
MSDPTTTGTTPVLPVKNPRDARRAALGSYLGATLEYYDFVLYSTASALVFPAVFFSQVDPATGVVLSFLTLAVGYVVRPLGAILFGHFGDRLGRKKMLIVTMVLMGVASVGIGIVPSGAQVGPAAALVLVALRAVQGVAVGGEWAGASLMAMEHATARRRGLAGSIVASGGPSGAVLATLVFSLVSLMPAEDLLAWGWRIPFLASAVILVVALVVRAGVRESPEFTAVRDRRDTVRVPLVATLAQNWRSVLVIVLCALAPFFAQSVTATFGLRYAVANGNDQAAVLAMLTVSNLLTIVATIGSAALSDRFGRRPTMLVGYVAGGSLAWAALALLTVPNIGAVLLAFVILQPIVNATIAGPLAAFMAELFPVRTRFTGVGLSYQLASTLASGFAPLVATALVAASGGTTTLLATIMSVLALAGVVATLAARRLRVEDAAPPVAP